MTLDKADLKKLGVQVDTRIYPDRIEYYVLPPIPSHPLAPQWPLAVYDAIWNLIQDENKGRLPVICGGPVHLRSGGQEE
jgi:hypothetical protein